MGIDLVVGFMILIVGLVKDWSRIWGSNMNWGMASVIVILLVAAIVLIREEEKGK